MVGPRDSGEGSSEKGRKLLTKKGTGRAPGSTYWLIAKNENGRVEVLTVDLGEGEHALPVFGYEEDAEMFLCLGSADDGWRLSESTPGELVSVRDGPCARVGRAVLDPLPQMVTDETVRLVSLDRERLLGLLLGRGRPLGHRGSTRESGGARVGGTPQPLSDSWVPGGLEAGQRPRGERDAHEHS